MILDNLRHDFELTWRGLRRAKAFSAAAILTLGLGIAGTTVMFTLIQGVLLRPLPVREQDRLIVAWKELRSSGFTHHHFGDAAIDAVGRASQLLEHVAGVDANGVGHGVISDGASGDVKAALVTGAFFEVLGVEPILGRPLTPADDVDGAEKVVVISHGLWQRRYGGSRDVIGRRITLSEQRFAVVGVMPPDLDYPSGVEVWRTTHSVWAGGPFGDAARREVDLLARLRPGVTIEQASAELMALTQQFGAETGAAGAPALVPVVRTFEDVVVGDVRSAMIALMAAVALVLLIASANAANLLLMRGEGRRRELGLREALGASRSRIVRYVLAESLVLTLLAAAGGLLATWWSLQGLLALVPEGLPRVESVRIDATVLVFGVATALVTSVLAGLVPALSLARADLVTELRGGGRGATGSGSRQWRRGLVVAQVALAVTIVAAAGLLTRSVLRLQAVEIGLSADRLVFVQLSLADSKYADRARHAQFLDQAVTRLEMIPVIAAATPVNATPFSGEAGWDLPRFAAEGQSAERAAANPSLNLESVYSNYFRTFEIPLVRGRAFTSADRIGAVEVAIVSEDVAARTWPGESPIGKRLKMGRPDSRDPWRTVVGVAASTRYRELARPRPTIYLPAPQFLETAQVLVLRTTAPLDQLAALVRSQVSAVDPDVQVMGVAPFSQMLDRPLARPRFNAFLLSLFAVTALLLATIGLYAVLAASVRQRDRELAIRVALGATPMRVRRLVVGEALWLAGVGASIGLVGATAATRIVRGMLFEIRALDPPTLVGAALLLILASGAASYWPVRRATRVDAVAMLRN
jgi:putative ABC transport system permease protein